VNECGCTKICRCVTVESPSALALLRCENGSGEEPEPHYKERQSELAVLLATLTLASATLLSAALTGLIRLVLLSALVAATLLATLVLLVHAFV
jgi:hypothetical protein